MLSPNCTSPRKASVDTITPHCVAGNLEIESTLDIFMSPERQASCNYTIGTDGRIGLGVDEDDRAWTSSSGVNDRRAITMEIANDGGEPDWHMSDEALESFICLSVDICQRYGFQGVYFDPDKDAEHRNDGYMRITLHRWFANTDCPGDYLISQLPCLVDEINSRMGGATPVSTPTNDYYPYKVKVTATALNIRDGAGTNFAVVGSISDEGIYTVVDEQKGIGASKWGRLKSGAGWISLDYVKRI